MEPIRAAVTVRKFVLLLVCLYKRMCQKNKSKAYCNRTNVYNAKFNFAQVHYARLAPNKVGTGDEPQDNRLFATKHTISISITAASTVNSTVCVLEKAHLLR